jgi:flavin-dependent dehydrogenase
MSLLKQHSVTRQDFPDEVRTPSSDLQLKDGSRVGVIGGGPAGSFFSYFLLEMADRIDLKIKVDIFEPKDFSRSGPHGCNKCGGIISETLVQHLAAEGINLPANIVQRGIDSYIMHTDVGSARIETPLHEKRIGAVHRGCGPHGDQNGKWDSFDGFLLKKAVEKGAKVTQAKVNSVQILKGFPNIEYDDVIKSVTQRFDLIAIATGINTAQINNIHSLTQQFQSPLSAKTFIKEFQLGYEVVEQYLGSSMHVFLLNIPRLEFAAIIPKGDFVTLCMLGKDIDKELIASFVNFPEVKNCFPPNFQLDGISCQCWPSINTQSKNKPFNHRVVFIGDSGYTRLYKDGIGAAYITAKAAANTAILQGISTEDFEKHYWPVCKRIDSDNRFGKLIFMITKVFQYVRLTRKAILRTIAAEQKKNSGRKTMSNVLWDMFTGSSSYRDIFLHTLHPTFIGHFLWNTMLSMLPFSKNGNYGG